jgi:hypothetical protein
MSLTKVTNSMISGAPINVLDFGADATGATNSYAAIQAAFTYATTSGIREIQFPSGVYRIDSSLTMTSQDSIKIIGLAGYDGANSIINGSSKVTIKWGGASAIGSAMFSFDRCNGLVIEGLTIDCNFLAGYGIQIYSSSTTNGSVTNTVQKCNISNAQRDGIIVGTEGTPTAIPGGRQFYCNRFQQITFYGCQRSGLHINEWNADLGVYDQLQFYRDWTSTWVNGCAYGIWFDYGGQSSTVSNCIASALSYNAGIIGSGYLIFNKSILGSAGAQGLLIQNCWQETGAGGLLYSSVANGAVIKPTTLINCQDYSNGTLPSVTISAASSYNQKFIFQGCTFSGNINISTSVVRGQDLTVINTELAAGKYIVDYLGNLTTANGEQIVTQSGGGATIGPYAKSASLTMTDNIGALYFLNECFTPFSILIKQSSFGNKSIAWAGSGQMGNTALTTYPQPNVTANSQSMFTFFQTPDGKINIGSYVNT